MKLSLYNAQGAVVGDVELNDAVFSVDANVPLMHQAVVQHLANRRVGTAATKTRAAISGTTKKMYKQKGTGRARHGSRKVPSWIGGGVAHGPHPRSYHQAMPKKMRRAAIKSALSVKARDNQIVILDELKIEHVRTKEMLGLLERLPVNGKVLLTMGEANEAVVLSTQNIIGVRTLPATGLSTYDLLNTDFLVATLPAIRQVEAWLGTAGAAAPVEVAPVAVVEAAPAKPPARARAKKPEAAPSPAVEPTESKPPRAPRARKKEAGE